MPLLLPPGPDLRPSDLTYTDGYNSIVSRVRRKRGTGNGGVVIIAGIDLVSAAVPHTTDSRMAYSPRAS